MRRDVPRRRAAQREAADRDAVLVDGVTLLHVGQRLEDIGLARELLAVAVAAVGVEDDGVARSEITVGLRPP
ncbi:hypothetical protein D3C83_271230 [compost metagenome]